MSAKPSSEARRLSLWYGYLIILTALFLGGTPRPGTAQGPAAVSFRAPITYDQPVPVGLARVGGSPLVAADLDGDGRLDLIVIAMDGLSLLYGNGDGTFAPPVEEPLGPGLQEGVVADVNGDGLPDLVFCHFDLGKVAVLLNQGGRQFASPTFYAASGGPVGITAADFDGDGRPDLAVSCHLSDDLVVLLNRGDGTFLPPVVYGGIGFPGAVLSGDWNGDGRIDLAQVSLTENSARILLGDGKGKFTEKGRYRTDASYAARGVAADFNGDGIPDLAIGCQDGISLLFGDGNGGFGSAIRYRGFWLLGGGDFDGDGAPDLVAAGYPTAGFSVYLNRQSGNLLPPVVISGPGETSRAILVGDFNRDGRPDVVAWNDSSPYLAVFLNNTPRPTPAIRSLALTPDTLVGGCDTVTGEVTLTEPAPAGGLTVDLHSTNPAVTVPANVLVPGGASGARFTSTVSAVASLQRGTVTASYQGSGKRTSITVQPGGIALLKLTPTSVIGGQSVTGEVSFPCPAGAGGLAVTLVSGQSGVAAVPASVPAAQGATSVTFTVTTLVVAIRTDVVIMASFAGQTVSATLAVRPVPPPPPPPPAVNLLVNGSFEEPDTSSSTIGWLTYGVMGIPGRPPAAAGIPGWKITQGTVDVTSWYWKAAVGRQSLDLVGDNPGTIEQSFATDVGKEYLLSGVIAHNPANFFLSEGRGNVFVNRTFLMQLIHEDSTATVSDMHWMPFSIRFRATTPMTTLTISDATDTPFPGGLVLDDLAVTPAGN